MINKLHLSILGLQPEPVLPTKKAKAAQLPNQEQNWQEQIWHWPPAELTGGALAAALRSRCMEQMAKRLKAPQTHADTCQDDPETLLLARFAAMDARGTAAFALQADLTIDAELRLAFAEHPDIVAVSQVVPVHLQAGTDNAVLMGMRFLRVEPKECAALHSDLNQWLQADGIFLFSAASGRLYLGFTAAALERVGTVDLPPLGCALNRPVGQLLVGDQLRPLRRWLTELQMWLYTHPVNAERAKKARPEINSLWLWGRSLWPGAPITESHQSTVIAQHERDDRPLIYTDSAVLTGALRNNPSNASVSDVVLSSGPLPNVNDLAEVNNQNGGDEPSTRPLHIIWSEPLWGYLEGDVAGWNASLDAIDQFLSQIQPARACELLLDNGADLVWQRRHWLTAVYKRLFPSE